MINLFGYAGPDQEPKNPCSKSLIFMKMRSTGIRVVGVRILLFCAVNLQGVRCSSYDVIKALGWGFFYEFDCLIYLKLHVLSSAATIITTYCEYCDNLAKLSE